MTDPRIEDHLVGVELQLVELVESQERAKVQGRDKDAAVLTGQIEALQSELGAAVDRLEMAGVSSPVVASPPAEPARPIGTR
jgi:hypothetical protein